MIALAAKTISPPSLAGRRGALQRKCACGGTPGPTGECSECKKKRLQRRANSSSAGSSATPPIVGDVLNSPGQPLDVQMRAFMEPRFGRDFSHVRVHTDGRAAQSAAAINAEAYTSGRHIAFGEGKWSPATKPGRQLLAHELSHVVQQGSLTTVQSSALPAIRPAHDPAEGEAETAAASVVSGGRASHLTPLENSFLQRQPSGGGQEKKTDAASGEAEPKQLTRPEERRLSLSAPGQFAFTMDPVMISLYNFGIDKATLKSEHKTLLKELAALMKLAKQARLEVLVTGHTDSSGEADVNNPLSKRRALEAQRALPATSGVAVQTLWFGEDRPIDTNETADGRSRNRRVDIYLLPQKQAVRKKGELPKKGDPDYEIIIILRRTTGRRTPEDQGRKKDKPTDTDQDNDDDGGNDGGGGGGGGGGGISIHFPDLCGGILAYLCGAAGVFGAKKIFCAIEPEVCAILDWLKDDDDSDDDKKKEKEKDKDGPKERKACPLHFAINPSPGVHRIDPAKNGAYLKFPFTMSLKFQQESPDHSPYCDCNCGEYRQEVKGWFERDYETGKVQRKKHLLSAGTYMEPNDFLEDGEFGGKPPHYGHRYLTDFARLSPKANASSLIGKNAGNDQYLDPNREDGCTYEGKDAPGVEIFNNPKEEVHFHLWFRGGPVDACHGDEKIGDWLEWEVVCDRVPPKPPPAPTPTPTPTNTNPRIFGGIISSSTVALVYDSGFIAPMKWATQMIKIRFHSQGEFHTTHLEVLITDVTSAGVHFLTTNTFALNIAPQGHPPIAVGPHSPGFVPQNILNGP